MVVQGGYRFETNWRNEEIPLAHSSPEVLNRLEKLTFE
jgi:hypothetical protein